jgi:hypothetical protein
LKVSACLADACQIGDAFCPVGESVSSKFTVLENFENPIVEKHQKFVAKKGLEIVRIKMITDREGQIFTYDVNTNTNNSSEA